MTVVVDTSVLVDLLRGDTRARAVLRSAADAEGRLCGSVLTRAEVLAGMRTDETEITTRLVDSLQWIDVTVDIADAAATFARRYLLSHRGIDLTDLVIAATAEASGGRLLTQNVRHFPMFHRPPASLLLRRLAGLSRGRCRRR